MGSFNLGSLYPNINVLALALKSTTSTDTRGKWSTLTYFIFFSQPYLEFYKTVNTRTRQIWGIW